MGEPTDEINNDRTGAWTRLREPFPPEAIGKLPKGNTTLDYVGHAAVTDRLLAVDPEWSWEPMAYAADGGPLVRFTGADAELWIRLTVCGLTRIGVGTAPAKGFEVSKQLVSDAIRNGAMRFGVALDLWAKEDLHAIANPPAPPPPPPEVISPEDTVRIRALIESADDAKATRSAFRERFGHGAADLPLALLDEANDWLSDLEASAS